MRLVEDQSALRLAKYLREGQKTRPSEQSHG